MSVDLQAMESLLLEICEEGAEAEDKGINRIPSFDPLIAKARYLGIDVPVPATLDDLRSAVENACEAAKSETDEAASGKPVIVAAKILGNEAGIPGDGP
jgi:hypothetical protein